MPGYVKKKRFDARSDRNAAEQGGDRTGGCAVGNNDGIVCGRNAVRELIRSGRAVDKIFVLAGPREGSVNQITALARERKIPVIEAKAEKLDALCGGVNHQGICAMAAQKEYSSVEDILAFAAQKGEAPFLVIADGIEDPHNLGALIRCAECAGVHGIIIPQRRSVGITPTVAKASAGAIEHILIAKVTNLASAVDFLKKNNVWIYASEAGGTDYFETDFSGPCAVIFGSEGSGISHLLLDKSDFQVSIPMYGSVNSLNVSTAASVILCHAARAHHK